MLERSDEYSSAFSKEGGVLSSSSFIVGQESNELHHHLTIGATPLAGVEYPDVLKIQEYVREALMRRTVESAFHDIPAELQRFMVDCFNTRFAARALKNYGSYAERLHSIVPPETPDAFNEQHERAIRGIASPEELIVVRRTLGMKAIELARLTHPYGAKIELLDPMRGAVRQAILNQGGIALDPEDYQDKYKIRSADLLMSPDDHEEMMGLLVTRRRNIGLLDDDTLIMERSSFVLPTYAGSAFDPELSRRMRNVTLINNPDAVSQLHEAGRIAEVSPLLLDKNDFHAAMPQSTTIFAYNKTTDRHIQERRELQKSVGSLDRIREMTLREKNFRPGDIKDMADRLDAES